MGYSQNLEEEIISEYFGDFTGTLLSVGENNGVTFSNSRLLIENGWSATLIEPSEAFKPLFELYEKNKKVQLFNCAVSNFDGVVTWYELSDSLVSTMDIDMANQWGLPYETKEVKVMHISHFKPETFDFITIDAEGHDLNILQQIDLTNVKCLCIECGNIPELPPLYTEYCNKYGMKLLHRNGENMIFVK